MRALTILLIAVAAGLLGSGCATVFTGTYDEVTIRSEPEGALILIDGLEEGYTPATLELKRPGIGDREVTLQLDGYEERTFALRKEFNAVSVINLACILCWAVDVATGAVTKYRPQGYDIELIPDNQAYRLDELERDAHGRYVVPQAEEPVVVTDLPRGLRLVFLK